MAQIKNVHKVAYLSFSLVVVILIGVIIHQQHQFNDRSQDTEQKHIEHTEPNGKIGTYAHQHSDVGDIKSLSGVTMKEFNELGYQLDSAEEELAVAQNQLSEEIDKQGDMKELQKMISQTPQALGQLRTTMRTSLDKYYSPIFAKLGISGEELEAFKNLIVDYQMARQEFFTKTQGSNFSEDQRMKMGQDIQAITDEFQNQMDELIGEKARSQYFEYREKKGELQFTFEFSEYLSGTDKMTDEQAEKLVDSMTEARKTYLSSTMQQGPKISEDPKEEQERIINVNVGLMEAYLGSADTILTPSQLERFEFCINKRIEQIKFHTTQ